MKSELVYQIEKEKEELEKLQKNVKRRLENAPSGSLHAKHVRHKYYQFYLKYEGEHERYMKRSEEGLMRKLAQKEYDKRLLCILDRRIAMMNKFMDEYGEYTLFDPLNQIGEGKRRLICPEICDDTEFVDGWMKKYEVGQNTYEMEYVIRTERGECVRSKSEKIIADKLYVNGIPYVYEPRLVLPNGHRLFPDFAVLNVGLRKEFYFEHFGMMDNPEYSVGATKKISEYGKNGYYFGKNLLYTFETREKPVDTWELDSLIHEYLC